MPKTLIISAHADDETFGMGATLARFKKEEREVHWLILTSLWSPRWSQERINKRKEEIDNIAKYFGFKSYTQWEYADNRLDSVDRGELQEKLIPLLEAIRPEEIYCPGPWDFNHEHRIAYELVEMCVKPFYSPYVKSIFSYEIPSSTEWKFSATANFQPNYYVNIEEYFEEKLKACQIYSDEIYPYPHGRSEEYLDAIARKRGVESGCLKAEAFCLLRSIY